MKEREARRKGVYFALTLKGSVGLGLLSVGRLAVSPSYSGVATVANILSCLNHLVLESFCLGCTRSELCHFLLVLREGDIPLSVPGSRGPET